MVIKNPCAWPVRSLFQLHFTMLFGILLAKNNILHETLD